MNIVFLSFIPFIRHFGGMQKVTDSIVVELMKRGHKVSVIYYEARKIPDGYEFSCKNQYIKTVDRPWDEIIAEWKQLLNDAHTNIVVSLNHNEKALRFLKCTPSPIKRISFNHLQPFPGVEYVKQTSLVMQPTNLKYQILKWAGILFPYPVSKYYEHQERDIITKTIDNSDLYGVLTKGYIERIAKYVPKVNKEKLFSIPNPNPLESEAYIPEPKENILLYLGRLSNVPKNLIGFIRVWQRLEKKNPDWKALVVGTGPIETFIKNYCHEQGIPRIYFEGSQRDVIPYYKKAKIVCVTSFYESWNMSLTEGMSFGCVPVAFRSYEATQEIITDNVNGLLITPFDEEEMSSKIQNLMDDDVYYSKLSHNALEKSKGYALSHIVDKWEEIFNHTL